MLQAADAPNFRPGTRLAVLYNDDPSLWHERILLASVAESWLCLTPDGDIVLEKMKLGPDESFSQLRRFKSDRTVLGLDMSDVYRWEDCQGVPLAPAVLTEYITEAQEIARGMGAAAPAATGGAPPGGNAALTRPPGTPGAALTGPPPPALGAGGPAGGAGGAGLLAAALAAAGPGGTSSGASAGASGAAGPSSGSGLGQGGLLGQALLRADGGASASEQWVAVEDLPWITAGTVVEAASVTAAPSGVRGYSVQARGDVLVRKVTSKEIDPGMKAPVMAPGRSDFRTLPIERDLHGKRYVEHRRAIDKMTEQTQDDWPIAGPLTLLWLIRFMITLGGTCLGFHQRWMTECKLDYSAAGVLEHQGLCRLLDTAIIYDFLDLPRIAAFEIAARRLQMIHDRWKHKLAQYQPSGTDGAEDAFLILGTGETRGNLAMAPALTRWLGDELSKEAVANKERRKAREERALAAAKK